MDTTLFLDGLTFAVAVEDAEFNIDVPSDIAVARTPSPDFVSNVRLERDRGMLQLAGLYRVGGVQPVEAGIPLYGSEVRTGSAWGVNFAGAVLLTESTKTYCQILYGEGIGSYRTLPDAAISAGNGIVVLPMFGWMVGLTHDWNDRWSSNLTYAENCLDNSAFQAADEVHRTTYLAANLIWTPIERVSVGIEYLNGLRENVDYSVGEANRIQVSFIFDLP